MTSRTGDSGTNPWTGGGPTRADRFSPGMWADGDRYVGRAVLTRTLAGARSSVWIVGRRRMGKTSLLKAVERQLLHGGPDGEPAVPVFLNMAYDPSGPGFARQLLRTFRRACQRAGLALPPGPAAGAPSPEVLDHVEDCLLHWSDQPRPPVVYLLVDEAEAVMAPSDPSGTDTLDQALLGVRDLVERGQGRVRCVMASVKTLLRRFDAGTLVSPFLELFRVAYLGALEPDGARHLVAQGFDAAEDQDAVLARTGGHPWLIHTLCHIVLSPSSPHATEALATALDRRAAADVAARIAAGSGIHAPLRDAGLKGPALSRAVDALLDISSMPEMRALQFDLDHLDPHETAALQSLARGNPAPIADLDIADQRMLVRLGYLRRDEKGTTSLAEPLFGRWLDRRETPSEAAGAAVALARVDLVEENRRAKIVGRLLWNDVPVPVGPQSYWLARLALENAIDERFQGIQAWAAAYAIHAILARDDVTHRPPKATALFWELKSSLKKAGACPDDETLAAHLPIARGRRANGYTLQSVDLGPVRDRLAGQPREVLDLYSAYLEGCRRASPRAGSTVKAVLKPASQPTDEWGGDLVLNSPARGGGRVSLPPLPLRPALFHFLGAVFEEEKEGRRLTRRRWRDRSREVHPDTEGEAAPDADLRKLFAGIRYPVGLIAGDLEVGIQIDESKYLIEVGWS